MNSQRTLRTLSVIATAALIVGAGAAGTADAKKKKKPKPPPAGCAPYVPSEWSADIPVTKVTDEHTAEAPLEIEVPTAAGFGTSDSEDPANQSQTNPVSHAYLNVQVDSSATETGLYGTLEFTPAWDYDLYFRNNEGLGLAYSAGFSPFVNAFGLDGTGHGGHSGVGSENVEGLTTPDCTGYLVDVVSSTTPGETTTLKLWTGEATYAPE